MWREAVAGLVTEKLLWGLQLCNCSTEYEAYQAKGKEDLFHIENGFQLESYMLLAIGDHRAREK
jgi:hypothetical protein